MKKLALGFVLMASLQGCMSTWATLNSPSPYCGIRFAVMNLESHIDAPTFALILADMPFSFVLDTALLPITVVAWLWASMGG